MLYGKQVLIAGYNIIRLTFKSARDKFVIVRVFSDFCHAIAIFGQQSAFIQQSGNAVDDFLSKPVSDIDCIPMQNIENFVIDGAGRNHSEGAPDSEFKNFSRSALGRDDPTYEHIGVKDSPNV